MSKTTVTHLVQQLEARLRVRLLNRTTRKANVTADGAAFYEPVVGLLADMDDAETSLSSASAAPKGRMRVDVPSPLARMILVPALPAFHAKYPDIQFDMGVSDRMVDMIGEKVDCACAAANPPPVADGSARGQPAVRGLRSAQLPGARLRALAPAGVRGHASPSRGFLIGAHRQGLPCGRPGRPMAAGLHGQGAPGMRRTGMSAPNCACSSVGRRADGPACAYQRAM